MRPSDRTARRDAIWAIATIAACACLMLLLIARRGIWLDEAASFLFSRHDIGSGDPLRDFWTSDVHPPLYSAYAWLFAPLLGETVQSMRLVNLGGLAYAGMIWSLAWRSGVDRGFLWLLAILTLSTPFAMLYAAEFRSYFLMLTLGACLVVQLRMIDEGRGGWGPFAATALLSINLHYFGSMISLVLLGVAALRLRACHRPRAARAMLLIMAAGMMPLALSFLVMMSRIDPVSVNHVPAVRGLMAIGAVAGAAALNLAALATLRRAGWSKATGGGFGRLLALSLGAILVSYFLLNLVTQNLLPRHMIAAVPVGAAWLAHAIEQPARARRWVMPMICMNALLLAVGATWYGLHNRRWETNVELIDSAIRDCPQSRLYALSTLSLLPNSDRLHSVPHVRDIFATTYRLIAADAGKPVTILPVGRAIGTHGPCPALLWIEHLYTRPGASDLELAQIAGFSGAIAVERLQRDEARALLAIRSSGH